MRGLLRTLVVLALLVGGALYIAAPFWTAWSIREAMKTGDVATLRASVDWEKVRPRLRQSIAEHAQLLQQVGHADDDHRQPRDGWQVERALGLLRLLFEEYLFQFFVGEVFEV